MTDKIVLLNGPDRNLRKRVANILNNSPVFGAKNLLRTAQAVINEVRRG